MRPLTTGVSRGLPLNVGAMEGEPAINGNVADVVFPLKGKNVEECAPRMRFAPSPTGR